MSIFKANEFGGAVPAQRVTWASFTRTAEPTGELTQPAAAAFAPELLAPLQPAAEDVLRQARLEAAQILQEAASEAETAVAAAREHGFEAGFQEGNAAGLSEAEAVRSEAEAELARARAEAEAVRRTAAAEAGRLATEAEAKAQMILAGARDQAQALVAEATREQHRRLDDARDALVDLAVAAALRLVRGHLALRPDSVVAMVAAGLARLKDTNCTVRISPSDLPLLEAQRSVLEREMATGTLQIQPDNGLTPGSFLISSPQGQIDGRLESQEKVVEAALKTALGGNGS